MGYQSASPVRLPSTTLVPCYLGRNHGPLILYKCLSFYPIIFAFVGGWLPQKAQTIESISGHTYIRKRVSLTFFIKKLILWSEGLFQTLLSDATYFVYRAVNIIHKQPGTTSILAPHQDATRSSTTIYNVNTTTAKSPFSRG